MGRNLLPRLDPVVPCVWRRSRSLSFLFAHRFPWPVSMLQASEKIGLLVSIQTHAQWMTPAHFKLRCRMGRMPCVVHQTAAITQTQFDDPRSEALSDDQSYEKAALVNFSLSLVSPPSTHMTRAGGRRFCSTRYKVGGHHPLHVCVCLVET